MYKEKKSRRSAVDFIRQYQIPLSDSADLDPLIDLVGDSRYVLLGEASHGTHEYYTWRTRITKRLIAEKNFSFIAVEGDWPDCYRLNRYIKGYPDAGKTARDVLKEFDRWPTWMWANWETVALAEWLHAYNQPLPTNRRVGFYGVDVYSLWESLSFIKTYLTIRDPQTLTAAARVLKCFEPYQKEGISYAHASKAFSITCEDEVVNLLADIRRRMHYYNTDHEAVFSAEQNALIAFNAEQYYRAMLKAGPDSWNIRDRHMNDTINRLMEFHGPLSKVIVWEHNTHIGDARATDMSRHGMVNVGQLVKEQHPEDGVIRVGFGSYKGSVMAAREWNEKMEPLPVPPAPENSWEGQLHKAGDFPKLLLSKNLRREKLFSTPLPHRAIGVVYNPEIEQWGNYVSSVLPERYEAFLFFDETKAVHPLHIKPNGLQIPETYPWGD